MKYKFCPECGEMLIEKELGDEGLIPYCNTCKKPYFEKVGQRSDKLRYIKSYYYEKHELLMLGYLMKVEKGDFSKSIEVDELKWFSFDDAILKLRCGSIGEKHLLNYLKCI